MSWRARGRRRAAASAQAPTTITRERVGEALTRRGYRYEDDDDGASTGIWDGYRFWLVLLGEQEEILQVRGAWNRTLPDRHRSQLQLALNDWNRDRVWPKVYHREHDGELAVFTEFSVDFEDGVNDVQLDQAIVCGLLSGVQVLSQLDGAFPGPGDG